jgi:hypothetical protein
MRKQKTETRAWNSQRHKHCSLDMFLTKMGIFFYYYYYYLNSTKIGFLVEHGGKFFNRILIQI